MRLRYAYALGSLTLLGLWGALYLSLRDAGLRREMWTVSLWTLPLGLTESLFVAYEGVLRSHHERRRQPPVVQT